MGYLANMGYCDDWLLMMHKLSLMVSRWLATKDMVRTHLWCLVIDLGDTNGSDVWPRETAREEWSWASCFYGNWNDELLLTMIIDYSLVVDVRGDE